MTVVNLYKLLLPVKVMLNCGIHVLLVKIMLKCGILRFLLQVLTNRIACSIKQQCIVI